MIDPYIISSSISIIIPPLTDQTPWPVLISEFKIMNLTDSSWDVLGRGSARRKAATYSGKRKHTSMPRFRFEPKIP
jgi:hypothetical protein